MSISPADIAAWLPIARSIADAVTSFFKVQNRAPSQAEIDEITTSIVEARLRVVRAEEAWEAKHGEGHA